MIIVAAAIVAIIVVAVLVPLAIATGAERARHAQRRERDQVLRRVTIGRHRQVRR